MGVSVQYQENYFTNEVLVLCCPLPVPMMIKPFKTTVTLELFRNLTGAFNSRSSSLQSSQKLVSREHSAASCLTPDKRCRRVLYFEMIKLAVWRRRGRRGHGCTGQGQKNSSFHSSVADVAIPTEQQVGPVEASGLNGRQKGRLSAHWGPWTR